MTAMPSSQPLDSLRFPLHGSRLIEASAGTGKTFTIAQLYLRLVLQHGGDAAFARPLNPPDILVVTFTDAATQELRDRIRTRLGEAARCFTEEDEACDPALHALRETYPDDQWPACARALQRAAEWMDEAAVSTIHSWCYRVLREHAFDSGSLFVQELDGDEQTLQEEVVRDYWRRHFYRLSPAAAHAVSQAYKGPEALHEALKPLLRENDAAFLFEGQPARAPADLTSLLDQAGTWYAECDALANLARQAWLQDKEALAKLWHDLRPHLNGNSYRKKDDDAVFEGWLAALDSWAEGAEPPENIDRFGTTGIKLKGGQAVPAHPALDAIASWCEQRKTPPQLDAAILLHALHDVRIELDVRKQQRARIGFDDLLRKLDDALQGPGGARLAATLRAQFPVALIDEFQDTDPVQYRIFDAIYEVDANAADRALLLIGDPKQAIYGFRGADIHTYLQARAATTGRHYTLGVNYRSTDAMVDAVNRCFGHAEEHPRAAFRFKHEGDNPLPFSSVAAKGLSEVLEIDGAPVPALNLWRLAPEEGEVVGASVYRQRMADHAASAIRHWLAAAREGRAGLRGPKGWTPLAPRDIAVLVRNRREADATRDALARRGLPSVYLSDKDSVFASPEARDLLQWLRACAEPASDALLRRALATRSMGLPWSALDRLNRDEQFWEGQAERFRDYHRAWQTQGVLPMLRRLLADFDVPAHLLARRDGERALTNVLHLAEWLQRHAVELDGEHALIRLLADRIDQPGGEEVLRLESDADLVKVVTIHKSKGLEYPLVLLPFACTWREASGTFAYRDDAGRVIELQRDKKSPAVDAAQERADDARLSEDMRLLYVALTRARHATWVGVAPLAARAQNRQNELHKSAIGYLLNGEAACTREQIDSAIDSLSDGQVIAAVTPPAITDDRLPPVAAVALSGARVPQRASREFWWIASYSSLPRADENTALIVPPPVLVPRADEPERAIDATFLEERDASALTPGNDSGPARTAPMSDGIHRFPRGAGPGTFLHGILEWAGETGFAQVADDVDLRRETIARRSNPRGWAAWIDDLDNWMAQTLATALPLPSTGSVPLRDLSRYSTEMEFWFASHRVDLLKLDNLVCTHTQGGRPRPALAAQTLNGMFKGFIDLCFEHDGRYYVADYKSNWLGDSSAAYTAEAMRDTVLAARYELQYVIYLLALHRHLRARLPDYDYDRHVGGALCIFVRGIDAPTCGVHGERPPAALIHALDALFLGNGS